MVKKAFLKAKVYQIVMYIRISREDDDVGITSKKTESNSITNQRNLLYEFIHKQFTGGQEGFDKYEITEKCDDGYSGKKFERPGFMEMMEMAENNLVDCIIVKDFSRLGRDYVETGNYIEQVFPKLGIRFISVNDHYDSSKNINRAAGLDVAFKNVIYDFYSRDTSKKLRNVRRKMAERGEFASANAPYGYMKSRQDKHKLVINPDTAPVVRQIFELRLAGMSGLKITEMLNAQCIPSPAQYAINTKTGMDWRKVNEITGWDNSKVIAILKDERYTGVMVSLKRTLKGVYGKDTKVDKKDWLRVEGTHEAIIPPEMFKQVQNIMLNFEKNPYKINRYNPFTCGLCGRKLSKCSNKIFYYCRYGSVNPEAGCYKARYETDVLQGIVLEELKLHLKEFTEFQKIYDAMPLNNVPVQDNIQIYENTLEKLSFSKTSMYEQYKDGKLTKEEYLDQKKAVLDQIKQYEEMVRSAKLEQMQNDKEHNKIKRFGDLVYKYQNIQELTKEVQETFIDKVIVYSKERLKIIWKFEDVFDIIYKNKNDNSQRI